MKIRPAKIKDAGRIAEIHVESWQQGYRRILPAEFLASLDLDKREQMWRSLVEKGEKVYVAEHADLGIIGFVFLGIPQDHDMANATELTAIYLDPNFYGRGIGTTLWEVVEKELTTDLVYLWVLAANLRGIAFYEKNGFSPDGSKKNYSIGEKEFTGLRYQKHCVLCRSHQRPDP